jgi:hypothetical protein
MENHEKFSKKLRRINEIGGYHSTIHPSKDGVHLAEIRTEKSMSDKSIEGLKNIASLFENKEEQFNDSGCRILNFKYVFHINEKITKQEFTPEQEVWLNDLVYWMIELGMFGRQPIDKLRSKIDESAYLEYYTEGYTAKEAVQKDLIYN